MNFPELDRAFERVYDTFKSVASITAKTDVKVFELERRIERLEKMMEDDLK